MTASSASRILSVWLLLGGALLVLSCDKGTADEAGSKSNVQTGSESGLVEAEWAPPAATDLTKPADFPTKELDLPDAQKFPDCYRLFEPEGTPLARFPLDDAALRPLQLAGCAPETYRILDDGARLVGYATPAADKGWHLRVVYYEASGERRWHQLIDRSANAEHFSANFRGSFIAPLLPRLVCAGTLWEGGTQAGCFDAESGEERWSGMMKFWSGIRPVGLETSLNAASIRGVTRRYPYSGVEMRFREFNGRGGRAAYYATDQQRLFFVPAKSEAIAMSAYALETLESIWRLELPARPKASWTHAFAELGIVLFKLDETIYAADGESGELLWAARVGSDEPPLAAIGDKLYLLLRRKSGPNLLFSLDGRSGSVHWRAQVPTGTLELHEYEETLVLRSVRAVQRVDHLD